MNTIKQSHILSKIAFLTGSHVSLLESVRLLSKKTQHTKDKKMFDRWMSDLEEGKTFSFCVKECGVSWHVLVSHMVEVGEMTGTLSKSISHAASELRRMYELRQKMIGVMIYPLCIALATIGITSGILLYVLPKIIPLFESLHTNLPLSTKMLLAIHYGVYHYGLYVLLFCVITIFSCVYLKNKYTYFTLLLETVMRSIPFLGDAYVSYEISRAFRIASLLLHHHISIEVVFSHLSKGAQQVSYAQLYHQCADAVSTGATISSVLSASSYVPDLVVDMCVVGESSGNMSETCMYISEYYENELNAQIKKISSLIEPVLMIVLGVVVGFVAISVISPMYEITQGIK